MISKNKIKLIRSLETKKGREKHQLFVAEGHKVVADLVAAGYHAEDIFDEEDDIKKVSFLQHPQAKLGVFRLPEPDKVLLPTNELALALDGVQDPGNLGTIIRIADWFGIKHIFLFYGNGRLLESEGGTSHDGQHCEGKIALWRPKSGAECLA